MNAFGSSVPISSRYIPITALSATSSCSSSRLSSSAGATWNPLYLISSLILSTINTFVSSSMYPTSPVWKNPSLSIESLVASGLFKYPFMTFVPLKHSSPTWFTPSASPCSFTTFALVLLRITPEDPSKGWSFGVTVTVGLVSVSPTEASTDILAFPFIVEEVTMFLCVNITPLDSPVVPEEYDSMAILSTASCSFFTLYLENAHP
ncbi:hypothetical protein AYI70_g481 [Smittium culicis]|uniref:Uncharacterized protein n=1 Tax=Smittium culicis TaxID=133412 RepID=A0A1R1YGL6_9FUNG|nr:hypothetical protein AYI70_g481 [Smittium culicis]